MVAIPVKLYTGTESKDVSFRQLDREDHSRVRQLRWNMNLDREVPYDQIVRGYEYAKDRYVVLEDEDFDKLPLPTKRTIAIRAFVNLEEIDPVYHEKAYYLEPDEAGGKPFALLMRALEEKGLVAVAQVAIRNKERLCALRPADGRILLETLFYPDEIRTTKLEPLELTEVSDEELAMAFTLIEMLEQPFEPDAYHDDYREALMAVITAKPEGQEIVEAAGPETAKVVDLMAALKASVEAAGRQHDADEAEADAEAAAEGEAEASSKPRRSRTKAKAG
jgi:DNA end-binding protein Ku